MRQIKFRGLRTDGKGWVYGYIDHNEYNNIAVIHSNADTTQVIPESIGQFTGLRDKNGVEIYEGDVLKYYQPYSKKWETHFVLWDDKFSCFGLFEKDNEWCKESDWMKIQEIEIIGNIHTQDGGQEG